jgi:flagellar hook-length control protein FliK
MMMPTLPALPPRPEVSAPVLPDAGGTAATDPSASRPFARALREAEAAPTDKPESAERRAARARNEAAPRERTGAPRSGAHEPRDTTAKRTAHKTADTAADRRAGDQEAKASEPSVAVDRDTQAAPNAEQPGAAIGIADRAPLPIADEAPAADTALAPATAAPELARGTVLPAAGEVPAESADATPCDGVGAPAGRGGHAAVRGLSSRHAPGVDGASSAAARSGPASATDGRAAVESHSNATLVSADPQASSRAAAALDAAATSQRPMASDASPTAVSLAAASTPLADRLTLAPASGATTTVAAGTLTQAQLGATVGSTEFAPALGGQLAVWLRDGVQEAQLQLHPAELGPVAVQIALDGMQAQVDFHAAHARTREAIEASLPSLAAALRDAGFTLAGGGVFGQGAGESGTRHTPRADRGDAQDSADAAKRVDGDLMRRAPPGSTWRRGLLDVFA